MAGPIRCAIYTRQSHDERADAALAGTERQRELCAAYVASQASEGWIVLPDRFDDPGRSGGSLDRPALQRLMAAVDAGEVDVVVVQKLDRLSRVIRESLDLLARFDGQNVTFVSITQHLTTTTVMGRFTLNIMLSLAQMERELTSERTRERNALARKKGLWTAGPAPFGYQVEKGRLTPHAARAELVRHIYRRFIALRAFGQVADELNAAGHRNRQGLAFEGRLVKAIVSRRIYRGELPHRGGYTAGTHRPIVSERLWNRAQEVLAEIGAKPHRW